jgi:hypothetical protein
MDLNALCSRGQAADRALTAGDFAGAEASYRAVADTMLEARELDSFVCAKATLGLLLALVGQGRHADAHAVWIREIDDVPWGLGVYALEHGHTSVHDLMVYSLVSAFLHSLGAGDREAAADAVESLLGRVLAHAAAEEPDLAPVALSNWRLHLHEIYEGEVPDRRARARAEAERQHGAAPLLPLRFAAPSPWRITWGGPETVFYPDGSVEVG